MDTPRDEGVTKHNKALWLKALEKNNRAKPAVVSGFWAHKTNISWQWIWKIRIYKASKALLKRYTM